MYYLRVAVLEESHEILGKYQTWEAAKEALKEDYKNAVYEGHIHGKYGHVLGQHVAVVGRWFCQGFLELLIEIHTDEELEFHHLTVDRDPFNEYNYLVTQENGRTSNKSWIIRIINLSCN